MHRLAATGLLSALLFACSSGSSHLQGTWVGERAEGVRQDQQLQAASFVSNLKLVFDRDYISVVQDGKTSTGRYKLHHEDKASVVIYSGEGVVEPQTFAFLGDKKIRWVLPDERSIILTRASQ